MVKIGLAAVALSVLMAGAASAKTYVTTTIVNPPGPGALVVQKKIVKAPGHHPHVVGTRRVWVAPHHPHRHRHHR